jgi:hypothetical protein
MKHKTKVVLVAVVLLVTLQIVSATTLLYEDFEGATFPPTNWTTATTGSCVAWVRRTSGLIFGAGSGGVRIFAPQSGGNITGTSYLRTPSLNFSSSGIESLSFYFRCPGLGDAYGPASSLDTIKIEVSTNGTDWTPIKVIDSNYIYSLPPPPAIRDSGYKQTVNLSAYNGQSTVYIRWMLYDNFAEGATGTNRYFNIDSVWVYDRASAIEEIVDNRPIRLNELIHSPINNVLTIKYNFPNTHEVRLRIFDCAGNLVRVFADVIVTRGLNTLSFDISTLESGIYFYIIGQSNTNILNGKFVIVR